MGLKNTLKKREGEITYDIPFMWNLKRNDTNELTNRKRLTDLEKELMVCSEGVWGRDGYGVYNGHVT